MFYRRLMVWWSNWYNQSSILTCGYTHNSHPRTIPIFLLFYYHFIYSYFILIYFNIIVTPNPWSVSGSDLPSLITYASQGSSFIDFRRCLFLIVLNMSIPAVLPSKQCNKRCTTKDKAEVINQYQQMAASC